MSMPRPGAFALATLPLVVQAALAQGAPAQASGSIEVVGRRQGGGYEAGQVDGTKSTLPLLELPQSVRVISRQAIDDLGAVRLDDVLDHVGGISRQNNFGGLWDNIAIRGLAGNENTGMAMLLNGLAGNRGFNAPRDMADVERVEFLKGPVAALYGASEPGGTVNLVTKKPLWKHATSAEIYAGSWDSYRLAVDTTGPLGEAFAYRLNLAAEDRGSFRDFVQAERQVVAPAFTWRIDAATTLDYTGQWLRHATPLDRGVQAIGDRLGAVPRTQFPGEPADGDVTVRNETHQLAVQRELAPAWRLRGALSWRDATLQGLSTEPSSVRPDGRTLWRQRRDRDYASDDAAAQLELQGTLAIGPTAHELLLGMEGYRFRLKQRMLRINPSAAAPYAIDLLAPVYGQVPPVPLPNTDTYEHQRGEAVTVQDAVKLAPDWRVVVGLRVERVEQSLLNRRTGALTTQAPKETSPRAGLTWLPAPGMAVFANAGRTFRPNPGNDAAGQAFAPEDGRAHELGGKWERADRRLGATITLFQIAKRNVVNTDAGGNAFATGEVASRGVEFDLAGQIDARWRVTASLGYTEATVEVDGTLQPGARVLNAPRVNGSVLAVREGPAPAGGRLGVGAGLTHVGDRVGQAYTRAEAAAGTPQFVLPAYTTAKLVAYWTATPLLRLSLDVDNVFDRTYYSSSFSRVWVTPGAPRNVTLGVQANF